MENMTIEKVMIANAMRKRRPLNATLELLPLCNMNCDMCYIRMSRQEMEQIGQLRQADEWIQLAADMAKSGVLFILLTGGEPLLFPDFQKLYLALKKMGMIISINTNGTLIDEAWADFFFQHQPRRINVTLYGANAKAYDQLCHYPEGFERALRGISLLKERGLDVKINGSATKANREDLAQIYEIGRKYNCPVHIDTYMLPGLHERHLPFEAQSRLLPEQCAKVYLETLKEEMGLDHYRTYVLAMRERLAQTEVHYPAEISCQAAYSSLMINWQGEMRPCVTTPIPSLDAFARPFEEVWQDMIDQSTVMVMHEKCTTCRLRPICESCAASAYLETGAFDQVPLYHCRRAEALADALAKEVFDE